MKKNEGDVYLDKSIEAVNYLLKAYGKEFKSINIGISFNLALRNAISAMNLRKAMEPEVEEHYGFDLYLCPHCFEEILFLMNRGKYMDKVPKFCPECGQRLKWGEFNGRCEVD